MLSNTHTRQQTRRIAIPPGAGNDELLLATCTVMHNGANVRHTDDRQTVYCSSRGSDNERKAVSPVLRRGEFSPRPSTFGCVDGRRRASTDAVRTGLAQFRVPQREMFVHEIHSIYSLRVLFCELIVIFSDSRLHENMNEDNECSQLHTALIYSLKEKCSRVPTFLSLNTK